jgi:ABC-type polysaccharide/polyol phosphate transport system ATPase subunit
MIQVQGISKHFKLYHSPADRLKEILFRTQYHKDFTALDNITFEVREGETLGIIGENGAGKSTLLKILSGIMLPDSGTIQINGKVTGLLELGTGFNYEMTGLENIYMNGILIGLTKDGIEAKKQQIIDFSELGDFINEPLKTYSSGMVMRLAFSIAIHADPTCFLVDEALAVGDAYFQQKCMRKIQEFRAGGGSIIFVSHDMNAVKTLCDKAIFLDHGKIISAGIPKNIIDLYVSMILQKLHNGEKKLKLMQNILSTTDIDNHNFLSLTSKEVELLSFELQNEKGEQIQHIESENRLNISFKIHTLKNLDDPHYGFSIRNYLGMSVFETNTYCMGIKNKPLLKGEIITATFGMNIPLSAGNYSISIGVMNRGYDAALFHEYLLYAIDIGSLKILKDDNSIIYAGVFNIKPTFVLK